VRAGAAQRRQPQAALGSATRVGRGR
jgi:hypothetical protein